MAQMVYVLTAKLEGKAGYGPVAVVTDQHVADEWIRADRNNDWVPLELDDLSTTGMADKQNTTFKPVPAPARREQVNQGVQDIRKNLEEAQKLLKKKIKTHARRKGHQARSVQTHETWIQDILNAYLMHRAQNESDQDPYIWDFQDWLKKYRGEMLPAEYEKMVKAAHALYLKTFGPK